MPNIKSAIKRVKQSASVHERNNHAKATMRSAIRNAHQAIENNDDNKAELVNKAIKLTDTAARKGLVHKNYANRQKSRLAKKAL